MLLTGTFGLSIIVLRCAPSIVKTSRLTPGAILSVSYLRILWHGLDNSVHTRVVKAIDSKSSVFFCPWDACLPPPARKRHPDQHRDVLGAAHGANMAALTNAADAAVEDEVELLGAALAGTEALLDRTIAQALEEADQDRAREQRVDEPSPAEKQPDEPPSQPSRALLHNVQASHDAAARHREDALQKAVAFRDDWRRRRAAAEARPPPPRPPRRRKPPEAPAKDNNGIAGAQLRGVAAAGATILAGAVAGPGRRPIQCRGDGVRGPRVRGSARWLRSGEKRENDRRRIRGA